MLVVTDQSVYTAQQKFSNSNNQELVFLHMRIYFAQLLYITNSRYTNSLKTDSDMRLNIQVISYLFLTVVIFNLYYLIFYLLNFSKFKSNTPWTDPSVVGDFNNPTYKGRQVIVTTKTLERFSLFLNSTFIPFSYDHAMGFFEYSLF